MKHSACAMYSANKQSSNPDVQLSKYQKIYLNKICIKLNVNKLDENHFKSPSPQTDRGG